MKCFLSVLAVGAVFLTSTANASAIHCDVPIEKRQPEQALKSKLEAAGMTVKRIKVEHGCYEVYAIDKNGQRREVYINPENLEILTKSEDS